MQFKAKVPSSSKHFLKLEDGESVSGVFRGNPHDFFLHWKAGRGTVCSGDSCQDCAKGQKASFRFTLNFIVKENGAYVAKIFEQGGTVYKNLQALHESGYDLEKTIVNIVRRGTGKNNTTYMIVPVKEHEIKGSLLKQLAQVKLHDLENPGTESDTDETASEDGFASVKVAK